MDRMRLKPGEYRGGGATLVSPITAAPNERPGSFDFIVFMFFSTIILTRQVEYHVILSYSSVIIFLMGYFLIKRRDKTLFRVPHPLLVAVVICYLLCVLVSTGLSHYSFMGYQQITREILFFAVLFFIHDYLRNQRQWLTVVKAIIFSGFVTMISVFFSAVTLFAGLSSSLSALDNRSTGIFGNPSATGLVLSVSFPVTLGYLQWRKAAGKPYAGELIWLFYTFALASALLTISRSTILSIVFSLIALNISFLWRQKIKILAIGTTLVGAIWLYPPSSGIVENLATLSRVENGLSGREFLWQRAWEIFQEHPVIGTGPSTYRYYSMSPDGRGLSLESVDHIISDYYQDELATEMAYPNSYGGIIAGSAHNIWLDTAANMGICGVLSVLSMFLSFTYLSGRLTRRLRLQKALPYYWVVRGCFVGVLAFFIRTIVEPAGLLKGALSESLLFWSTILLVISMYKYPAGFKTTECSN